MCPQGATYMLAYMVQHCAQASEFCCIRVRDGDVITGACYASVMTEVGAYIEVWPPAGYYLSLASGPTLYEDLPSEELAPQAWKPVE
eukprot:13716607-Alexandrium_andersonii.AAC.1